MPPKHLGRALALAVACLALGAVSTPATSRALSNFPEGTTPNGQPCGTGSECQSNICADAVCCDAACAGQCQSCALAGFEGNCRYVPDGQDPNDECPGAGSCGSVCDGSGGCRYAPAGAICALCARCDGGGHCNQYLAAGSDPGDQCGLCRVCPGDGPDCQLAAANTDPQDECPASAPETCGWTGDCDGQGSCAFHSSVTVCHPADCLDAIHHPADLCDGAGACIDGGSVACLPYECLDAVACRTDCADDTHCVGASYCSNSQCAAYLQRGEVCGQDLECITDHCIDGVCCDNACDGLCQACNLPADPGGCLPVPDGLDPREDCAGTGPCGGVCDGQAACRFPPTSQACDVCTRCDGAGFCSLFAEADSDPFDDCPPCSVCSGQAGSCRPAAADSDPLDDCPATSETGCQTTGDCDGAGACRLWPADTICVPASCADGHLEPADVCDGSGQCFDRGELDCGPYACDGPAACRSDCAADDHCLAGHHCEASACETDRDPGQACERAGQCTGGYCVDGVCCDTACDGACQRCDRIDSPGACGPVPAGLDPDEDCAGDGTCGGACDGAGGCVWPGSQTACGPCALCDGLGACAILIAAGQDPQDACGPCRVCAGDRDECVPAPAGSDPLDECAPQDASSCS